MRRIWIGTAVLLCVGQALAADRTSYLKEMIVQHRLKGDAIGAEAQRRGADHVGTAFNEIGAKEYACASLAFLLGKDDIFHRLGSIEVLELTGEPTDGDVQMLSIQALQYENWAIAADSAIAMSERDRVETWNLNCVRQHEIGEDHYVSSISSRAEFKVREDQFFVLGDIDDGFFERFRHALEKSNKVKTVALGSGGGSVRDAILAGLLIRQKGLDTTLNSDCYSACALLFLGGVDRHIWSPYPRLGFHQASVAGKALPPDNEIYRTVKNYVTAMGANSKLVLTSCIPQNQKICITLMCGIYANPGSPPGCNAPAEIRSARLTPAAS